MGLHGPGEGCFLFYRLTKVLPFEVAVDATDNPSLSRGKVCHCGQGAHGEH